jgi:uncharacterized protein DUF6228
MDHDQAFAISSARAPGKLSFKWTGPAYFDVVLEDRGLHAVSNVHGIVSGSTDLPIGFFEDPAENWRGWPGAKEWQSYEGDFQLKATADGKDHVFLFVSLAAGLSDDQWRAQATLVLEAGQLDRFVKDFHAFLLVEPRAA